MYIYGKHQTKIVLLEFNLFNQLLAISWQAKLRFFVLQFANTNILYKSLNESWVILQT